MVLGFILPSSKDHVLKECSGSFSTARVLNPERSKALGSAKG
jgi:hypothetical protein